MDNIDKMIKEAQLTDKQQLFVRAYVGEANLNATRAAEIAGYSGPRFAGSENLAKPYIKKIVNAYLDSISDQGIANKAFRLAELNKLYEKVSNIAEEEGLKQEAYNNQGKEYKTFSKDVLSSLQSIMEQAAKEMGHRDKRLIELSGEVKVDNTPAKEVLLGLIADED